jgi:hypothetical protein
VFSQQLKKCGNHHTHFFLLLVAGMHTGCQRKAHQAEDL